MNDLLWTRSCARYEELLAKDELLTQEEFDFLAEHQESCAAGIHTEAGLKKANQALQNWLTTPDDVNLSRPLAAAPALAFQKQMVSRRRFNQALLSVLATPLAAAARSRGDLESFRSRDIFERQVEFTQRISPRSRTIEALRNLLRPDGIIGCAPSADILHPEAKDLAMWMALREGGGFPRDRAAVAAFISLAPEAFNIAEEDREVTILDEMNLFVAGAPESSAEARLYLPYHDNVETPTVVSNTYLAEKIPYHFMILPEQVSRLSRSAGNQERRRYQKAIWDSRAKKLFQPRDYIVDGKLRRSFLLISRLPRGPRGFGDVILNCGSDGSATEGFGLLFDETAFSNSQLLELMKLAGKYFQVVLECEITRESGVECASKLRICEECPPVIIEESSEDLFK